jgi:hypothetical protein
MVFKNGRMLKNRDYCYLNRQNFEVANEITHLRLKRTGEWKTHRENAKAVGIKIFKTTDECLMTPNMSRGKLEYIFI